MHITSGREIRGLNEDTVFIDRRMLGVIYKPSVSTAEAFNMSLDTFRIISYFVTAPPTLITLHTKTCSYLQQSIRDLDTAGEKIVPR